MRPEREERPGRVDFEVRLEEPPDDEPVPAGGWSEMLKLALSTPGGQRILNHAVIAAAAVIVSVLFMGHDFLSKRQSTVVAAATTASISDHEGVVEDDIIKPPPIDEDLFGPDDDEEDDDEDGRDTEFGDLPPTREEPKPSPPPPMFIPNPRVPFEISVSNPDVVYNNEIFNCGLSQLPPGKRAWMTRRVLTELRAFIPALREARDALRVRGRGAKHAADRAFSLMAQLEKGKALIERGSAGDDEFNAVIRNLIASCQHLVFISNNGVPVTIPDLHEAANPAYAAWARENQDRPRDNPKEVHNLGGFR